MCGLAGIVEPNADQSRIAAVVSQMLSVLHHRGPDDEGTYFSGTVGLGFRRLSILDLSAAGHQPMSTPDGLFTIVFNGEIYNYIELKRELQACGHVFRSGSDTEVLLHSYVEWGRACLERLNGMWAFVIHDRKRNQLFGARDRFGIKPLYYYDSADRFIFASEIKAIRASGYYSDAVDRSVAASFLLEGRLEETDETFYAGIKKIPAGCYFEYFLSNARYGECRYWDIRSAAAVKVDNPAEPFAELFEDAVRMHMRSDVPVAIHLSGGLDSTAIACASARIRKDARTTEPLRVFSYIAPEYDESEYIRATVAQTAAHLTELQTSPEGLWADLRQMLWYQDEPVHTLTALVSFQLMRATASHGIKVVLNGQGGDETLAGYPSYFRNLWSDVMRQRGVMAAWREIDSFRTRHATGSPAKLLADTVVRQLFHRLWKHARYRRFAARRRQARLANGWFTPDLLRDLPGSRAPTPPDLNGALVHAQTIEPLPLYLRLEDRNSMAHSVEARLPFLDYRLAEFAFGLPPEWKLRGPWNKYVLREAMRGRIPENVRTRPDKMGFPVPAREWFAGKLLEPVMDVVLSRRAAESGRYQMDVLKRDMERHRRGEIDCTDGLFSVAQFELWASDMAGSPGTRPATASTDAVVKPRAAEVETTSSSRGT